MRYLGIDYGTKRIGLAVSDENEGFAFPYTAIPNDQNTLATITDIVQKEQIGGCVVGESKTLGGTENPLMGDIGTFIAELERTSGLTVRLQSEAFSSVEASRFAPQHDKHNDAAAAAIILQRFLDTNGTAQ